MTGPSSTGASSASSSTRPPPSQGALPDFVDGVANVSPANARIDLVNRNQEGKSGNHGALVVLDVGEQDTLDVSWKAFALATESIVLELLNIFGQIIYPLYPLLEQENVKERLRNRDHLNDKGFFATVMAACALTSARVRDGAYSGYISDDLRKPETSSEIFFTAAKECLKNDYARIGTAHVVEHIKAYSLLALTSIQYGSRVDVQQYLGKGFTLAAMYRFYDEKSWPSDLKESQRETYRRVYWATYMLDVYSAVVWNCFLRSQEIHAYVRYPNDTSDEKLSEISPRQPRLEKAVSWLVGWNFALDLYRVLEHVVNKARAKKFTHDDRRSVDNLVFADTFSDRDVMQTMLNMYYELPRQFKETPPMTGDLRKDIFGFQAANIQATLQLLRMILFSFEDGPGVERKCDVANEVLQVFHTIPIPYLRALSTPLVYQLGSIGQILGSVLEEPLSQPVYERVRTALVLMADLLQSLENGLHRSAGAAQGLRSQVEKLDQYMRDQRNKPLPAILQPQKFPDLNPVSMHHVGTATSSISLPEPNVLPNAQTLPEMHVDWPWQFFQEGNYYQGNMGGGSHF